MELASITATWKSGETARLYGYPVHRNGETIGIVCGDTKRGWDGYKLSDGRIVEHYRFHTRKDAVEFVEAK